ncbi:hypothetical protein HPB48_014655 [Haemaphysalis longicornis]|uniref:Uncharacterized protein n=1 Tax=Haemaphysalis longicornis TaxID=44386 RepID=A0A9J6GKD4_HAELO|nr:hypothetical protein HPB48_014655 [Haemaphysalis longicornis]
MLSKSPFNKVKNCDSADIAKFFVENGKKNPSNHLLSFRVNTLGRNTVNSWLPAANSPHSPPCESLLSGAWRDLKSETILHCFDKAGFSRGSSAAEEITAEADIDAAAVDGAVTVTSLGQLWEAEGNASFVLSGLDYLDLALADQDLVATEELTPDELALASPKRERPQIAVPGKANVTTLVGLSLGPPEQLSQMSTRCVCTCAPNRAVAICWTTLGTVF